MNDSNDNKEPIPDETSRPASASACVEPLTEFLKLDLKISYRCNNRCRFCVQGDKRYRKKLFTLDELKSFIIDNSKKYAGIVFTGGEPTIHTNFLELVSTASASGYISIQIQTNGRMFASMNFCRDTIEAGATEIAPALHGHNPELHDYLTRSPGSFKQTAKGIINLRNMGVTVLLNTVVTKSNFRHLPQIAKFLISIGVEQYQFAFAHPAGEARRNFYSVVPRKSIAIDYIHSGIDVGNDYGIRCYTEAIPFCFMQGYEKHVAESFIPESKIIETGRIVESYTTARKTKGKKKGPLCKKCICNETCEGPWREYPAHYGWSEFRPLTSEV